MRRREALRVLALAPAVARAAAGATESRTGTRTGSETATRSATMLTRTIPSSGEVVPAVGLGTWQTFDVGPSEEERAPLREVLRRFFAAGGRILDSSPMYGRSEAVVGDLLRGTPAHARALVATKVWTTGEAEGEAQVAESERRMGGRLDLVQVHNLVDVATQLATLRRLKAARRIRYVGVTHYALGAFGELERLVRAGDLDFVQLPYSAATREAEARLLPAARDAGVAVLVMRPFEQGALLRSTRGRALPPFAAEVGARSWAQLLLKFILSHPAVTAAIPATSKPDHLDDNVGAAAGRLLDARQREALLEALGL
jgi:aryl-alcohol dehydrogenase-like predicted oxidoreductase